MTTDSHPHDSPIGGATAGAGSATAERLIVSAILPADAARLQVARGLAATLGVALDFDIDTIADLRMAVDEMVTMLITRSPEHGTIELALRAEQDQIEAQARATAADTEPFDHESIGWVVLTSLVRDLDVAMAPNPGGGATIDIRLTVVADRAGS